ncbi:MAG TPA: ComEC/Rec2 family competence protein [Phycisphaerae bacterium]|nr:ComEC/Rec2 family competence protein [Phycisphaerae bacterium]
MIAIAAKPRWLFIRHNPLVPAAAIFLAGMTIGYCSAITAMFALGAALTFLGTWIVAEMLAPYPLRAWCGHIALSFAILFAGAAVWQMNQQQGEDTHLARFIPAEGDSPITLRGRVIAAPVPNAGHHGNIYFTLEATELRTEQGWIPAHGLAQIKWRASPIAPQPHRSDQIEAYGWLSRPNPALNPGALDMRQRLAADRVFAEVRVPRNAGIRILEPAAQTSASTLSTMRLFLRGKLLEQTATIDSDAADTMVALLLGQRDASIDDVSRAFADAGVAHLLAISGAHVVFLAAVVWVLLRFIPMRPQWREIVCSAVLLAYVLATPCGPPVVRAAIVLFMVLLSRLMRRPPSHMNMLSAAVICILLIRPADMLDAGFQLTFVCTAALLLMAERLFAFLFSAYIQRAELIADLANTRWARFTVKARKVICAAITANLLGTLTAAPLVLFHFQQFNLYGVFTGLLAFPVVAFTMTVSLIQLLLSLASTCLAAYFAPFSTAIAHFMIWLVAHLAALPGAALALRSPPPLLIAMLYLPILLWIARRWLSLSRAFVLNTSVATLIVTISWYAANAQAGTLRLQALSVGQGSSLVLTSPEGDALVINAGSRDLPDIVPSAIAPTLRINGVRHFDTMLVTGMDAVHAKNAAEVVSRFRPAKLLVAPDDGTTTFARMSLEDAAGKIEVRPQPLVAGDVVLLGKSAAMQVLWPGSGKSPTPTLIVMIEYAGRRLLLMDPANLPGLALSANSEELRCDAVLLLGPDRGRGDAALMEQLQQTGATIVIYSGRSPWSSVSSSAGTWNTANGAVTLTVDARGELMVRR